MAKRPVATVLTVIPSPATSREQRLQEADRGHPVGVGEVEPGDRLTGRGRADVDDSPPAALAHAGHDGAGEDAGRQHQRAVGLLPLARAVVEGAAEGRAAGVGDEDLDRPERLGDLGRERGEPLGVGGVGDERRRPLADLGRGLLQPLERATGDRDPSALPAPAPPRSHARSPGWHPSPAPPAPRAPGPCPQAYRGQNAQNRRCAGTIPQSARSSVVNGSFRGPKERRSFKPKVAGSTPVGRIPWCSVRRRGLRIAGLTSPRRYLLERETDELEDDLEAAGLPAPLIGPAERSIRHLGRWISVLRQLSQ